MSQKYKTPSGGELTSEYEARLPGGTCTNEMRLAIVQAARSEGIKGSEFMRRAVAFYLSEHFHKTEILIHDVETTEVKEA